MSKDGRKNISISKARERLVVLRLAYRQAAAGIPHAEARLAAGRARALEALGESRRWFWFRPAGLTAVIGTVVVLMVFALLPGNIRPSPVDGTGMQVVLSGQDYALYHDLDFYAWLAARPPATTPHG